MLRIKFYLEDFLRDCFKEVRKEPGYMRVLSKNHIVKTSKEYY